jgi:starch-binding outer membrane protein, SusD/RagB family
MKKVFILSKIASIMIVMLVLSSCQDLFNKDEIKANPNAVTDVDIATLISGTLVGVATMHEDTDVRIASLWAGELAGKSRQHQGFAQYIVQATTFDWGVVYPVASQGRLIQKKADALGDKWTKGVGQVIEALIIAKVTDLYGDIPYSQAFELDKYPTPKFDTQANVYASLIALLTDASTNLSAPTGLPFAAQDFIYGAKVANWKAAANTLKARLYLHLGDYTNASAGINSTDLDMLIPHGTSTGVDDNQNYDFFQITRKGDTSMDGAYLPVLMNSRIASSNIKTNETALYNHYFKIGISETGALDPNTKDGMFTKDSPHPILTYYENQLILAEANARLSTPDLQKSLDALNTVRAGLATGYVNGKLFPSTGRLYSNYALTDFDAAGIANPKAYPTRQNAMLYEIVSQRYILLFMQYEAFNDLRRLAKATPVIQLAIAPVIGTQLPQRFIYPQTEINTNPNTPNPAPNQFVKVPIF